MTGEQLPVAAAAAGSTTLKLDACAFLDNWLSNEAAARRKAVTATATAATAKLLTDTADKQENADSTSTARPPLTSAAHPDVIVVKLNRTEGQPFKKIRIRLRGNSPKKIAATKPEPEPEPQSTTSVRN